MWWLNLGVVAGLSVGSLAVIRRRRIMGGRNRAPHTRITTAATLVDDIGHIGGSTTGSGSEVLADPRDQSPARDDFADVNFPRDPERAHQSREPSYQRGECAGVEQKSMRLQGRRLFDMLRSGDTVRALARPALPQLWDICDILREFLGRGSVLIARWSYVIPFGIRSGSSPRWRGPRRHGPANAARRAER
jgi:hypothetical protein